MSARAFFAHTARGVKNEGLKFRIGATKPGISVKSAYHASAALSSLVTSSISSETSAEASE